MSKLYTQDKLMTANMDIAYGGGGGSRRSRKSRSGRNLFRRSSSSNSASVKSASKTQQSVQAEDSFRAATSFSGPALEQERRNTGNSNGPMNAQAQLENPKKPAGKRLFSQFNTDLNGGHADRNRGAVQAELLREGLSNSSSGDKIKLGVYSVSNLHPAGILANVANIQADIMNSE